MTDQSKAPIDKAEKLARALNNVMSGGRTFDMRLAAQCRDELRDLRARLSAAEAREREARTAALREAAEWLEGQEGYDSIDGEHPLVSGILALIATPDTEGET